MSGLHLKKVAKLLIVQFGNALFWLWRFGKNPYRIKKVMSEDEKERVRIGSQRLREKTS